MPIASGKAAIYDMENILRRQPCGYYILFEMK